MADLDELKIIKTQIIARMKEVTSEKKPSYNIDGQQVDWNGYLEKLETRLLNINKLIGEEEGPYELETNVLL